MYMFKGCPRCHGDLFKNSDSYGEFVLCLQCGYYLTDRERGEFNGIVAVRILDEAEAERETALAA